MNSAILIAIFAYFIFFIALAVFVSRNTKKESAESFFLNNRRTGTLKFFLSSLAAVISAAGTIGVFTEANRSGISFGIGAVIGTTLGLLAISILTHQIFRFGKEFDAVTIVDFARIRFGRRTAKLVAFLQVILLVAWIVTQAVVFSYLIGSLSGVGFELALFFSLGLTLIYTTIGGMKVDLLSDCFQAVMIFVFLLVLLVILWSQEEMISAFFAEIPISHFMPLAFGGFKWLLPAIFFGPVIIFGNTINWQRTFSARTGEVARTGFYLAAPLFFLVGTTMIFLGLISIHFLGVNFGDGAFYAFLKEALPGWAQIIAVFGTLSIVVSSIDSLLLGGAAILQREFFSKGEGTSRDARLSTFFFGIFAFLVTLFFRDLVELTLWAGYLSGAIAISLVIGLVWRGLPSRAAFWAIIGGAITVFTTFPFLGIDTLIPVLFVIFSALIIGILLPGKEPSHSQLLPSE